MRSPLRVFIGYDSREPEAYAVLAHSILRRASCQVRITPLIQPQLREMGLYTRERGASETTEFSLTRFLVPALSGFEGQSIFLDCDMLCQTDLAQLCDLDAMFGIAVHVCKHDYVPKTGAKFLGQSQSAYPRKNWSSFMVFDNARCQALTPEYVNKATGLELHRFHWLKDHQIGGLDLDWNWLVGEYAPKPDARILHYTLGGPWFDDYKTCDQADLWLKERDNMLKTAETAV